MVKIMVLISSIVIVVVVIFAAVPNQSERNLTLQKCILIDGNNTLVAQHLFCASIHTISTYSFPKQNIFVPTVINNRRTSDGHHFSNKRIK